MKNLLLVLFSFVLIVSCDNTKKYEGKWFYYTTSSLIQETNPEEIIITKDTIKYKYPYFEYWETFAVNIKNRQLSFNGIILNSKIIDDTLIIDSKIKYVTEEVAKKHGRIYEPSKVKIELPKLDASIFNTSKKIELNSALIMFGKKRDRNEYALKLNDKYTNNFNNLHAFLTPSCTNGKPYEIGANLFCDSNAKMKDLEKILLTFSSVKLQKINFINNIKSQKNDSVNFNYEYESLNFFIPPLEHDYEYTKSVLNHDVPRFQYETTHPMFWGRPNHYPNVISLIKNQIYFNNNKINKFDLFNLLEEDIIKTNHIISVYDLESDYRHFIELRILIRSAYYKIRERKSQSKFNKSLRELSKDELKTIKLEIPAKTIWNYSIPHFKTILNDGYGFFGMKIKPIDSILPKSYLKIN